MDRQAVAKALAARGEPKFRMKQVMTAVYGQFVTSWEEATALPAGLREALADVPISTVVPEREVRSADGSVKAFFRLRDGKAVEAVLIPGRDSRTVCVSSQVGCAMGCAFCATGKLGFSRNLSADEIADQVLHFARELSRSGERVSHVVFMGMGEPFQNTEAVFEAIRTMNSPDGLGIGARKISISTCGIVPGIKALADFELQVNLAISLHAPTDDLRARLMPAERAYSIGQVLEAVKGYLRKTGRKVMFEYVTLAGTNDGEDEARELAAILRDMRPLVSVNLIPYNDTGSGFRASGREAVAKFEATLRREGIEVTVRRSAGPDVAAACGQLAGDDKR